MAHPSGKQVIVASSAIPFYLAWSGSLTVAIQDAAHNRRRSVLLRRCFDLARGYKYQHGTLLQLQAGPVTSGFARTTFLKARHARIDESHAVSRLYSERQ